MRPIKLPFDITAKYFPKEVWNVIRNPGSSVLDRLSP
jgi:hypothetical protein